MARGRFISNDITKDRQVHELSSDTCRLAFTWLITFADREGRTSGEPAILLAQLFPRRMKEITLAEIEGFIQEWVDAGFVLWYEGKDSDRVIQFKTFTNIKRVLEKTGKSVSIFASPEDCGIADWSTPE